MLRRVSCSLFSMQSTCHRWRWFHPSGSRLKWNIYDMELCQLIAFHCLDGISVRACVSVSLYTRSWFCYFDPKSNCKHWRYQRHGKTHTFGRHDFQSSFVSIFERSEEISCITCSYVVSAHATHANVSAEIHRNVCSIKKSSKFQQQNHRHPCAFVTACGTAFHADGEW